MKRILALSLILLVVLTTGVLTSGAQDAPVPSVTVVDQLSLDGTVWIDSVYSEGYGFVVIHIDNGSGGPGPVAGYRAVKPGWNHNLAIDIDTTMATPVLFAMLHTDDNTLGAYEFGSVEGADGPVRVNDAVVTPSFNATILNAWDQFVAEDGSITINSVTLAEGGWVVVHNGDADNFGAVAGATLVPAGTSTNVVVALTDPTEILWPMLHVDTGEVGTYEFGTVEGADTPIVIDGEVATTPIWTVPHVRADAQIAIYGDNLPADAAAMVGDMTPHIHVHHALSDGPGFVVIHSDNQGSPGPVLGYAPVADGQNTEIEIELTTEGLTPVVWPMLHVDTGEIGTYEFGTVEGADGPVRVNDAVVTFPINAAVGFIECSYSEGVVICESQIDGPGFLVIHADDNGNPGAGLASIDLTPGWNISALELPEDAGDTVWPMLHYDDNTVGLYEFGTVEGADGPVFVLGQGAFYPITAD